MTDTQDYGSIFATLSVAMTDTVDPGATIAAAPQDWRDTLRSSLPRLPLGDEASAQFQLSTVLGRGGMGVVHLAYQAALGRYVALKTVPGDRASRDSENALLQEARVMGLVEHPNVVPVHIIGQDDGGRPIIVMKRIDGTVWSAFLDGESEPDSDDVLGFHLTVVLALCRAISFSHSRNVLHRDIKPENVMIGSFGEVYVLDWGLAASMNKDLPFIPFIGDSDAVVGTPAYMAPEMTVGLGSGIGVHTDVFLIGAVLYHVITGSPPNRGQSLFDVLACSYEGRPRPYPDDVPSELRTICERAMAHDVAERFESVEDLRAAVESFVGHRNSYDLAATAYQRLDQLIALPADTGEDDVHRLFGETRFGFLSALEIWSENEDAKAGLERSVRTMIDFEIAQQNVPGARVLLGQLDSIDPELVARVDELERELGARAAQLEKLEYDYDENVGLGVKRWVVGFMAALFLVPPLWARVGGVKTVPSSLQWLSDDAAALAAAIWGLAFLPVLVGMLIFTWRNYRDHKSSRIFAEGLLIMYILGYGARSSVFWAGSPLHLAIAAEAAVYASSLQMLGIAVDRRLFPPGLVFAAAALGIALIPQHAVDIFCVASSIACLIFIFGDQLRERVPMAFRRPFSGEK